MISHVLNRPGLAVKRPWVVQASPSTLLGPSPRRSGFGHAGRTLSSDRSRESVSDLSKGRLSIDFNTCSNYIHCYPSALA